MHDGGARSRTWSRPSHEPSQGGAVLREHQVEHDSGGSYAAAERAMGEDWEDNRYVEDLGDWEMFWAELVFFAGGSFSFGRSGM